MAARENVKFLPVGSILDRYLVQDFLRIFFTILICVTSLYLIVDFFDRISAFLDTGSSICPVIRFVLSWNDGPNARNHRDAFQWNQRSASRTPFTGSFIVPLPVHLFLERSPGADIRPSSTNDL